MKKLVLVITLSALFCCAYAQKPFTLEGTILGKNAEGRFVKLLLNNGENVVGNVKIRNNKFVLKGDIKDAQLARILISPTKENEDPSTWKISDFYIDKGRIQLKGHIDSLPSYYYKSNAPNIKAIVEGSKAQSLSDQLQRSIKKEKQVLSKLNDSYLKEYHIPAMENTFNTQRGIALVKEMEEVKNLIFNKKWQFIWNNPQARVSMDESQYMVMGYGEKTLNAEQMDALQHVLKPYWEENKQYQTLINAISKAKATAIGSKFTDGPLYDIQGNKVQLASIFPKDKKYILLEFWASWCGPCRGEIPHLRHTYSTWKDKGFDIISISLDEKDSDWKKAMTEENMVWNQYNAKEGFESELAKSYDIMGIPYALLIDSEGKIVRHGMRGASLDQALEELLNK